MGDRVHPDKLPKPVAVLGWDGSDFRVILVDAQHHLQADVLSSALPDGAVTLAAIEDMAAAIGIPEESPEGSVMATLAAILAGRQPLGVRLRNVAAWNWPLAAALTTSILGTVNGSGYLTDVVLRVAGSATEAKDSYLRVALDAWRNADFILNHALYYKEGTVGQYAGFDILEWDTVNHIYNVHWKVKIPFLTSIGSHMKNADTVNAITFRALLTYRIDAT